MSITLQKMQRDHDSEMLPSTENSKPSRIPLVIWFVEVIVVIIICCVVIRMSFVPWPPTYALFDPTYIDHDSHTHVSGKTNQNGTIIFLLRIRNPNEGKGIIHGETKINLYKDGFIVGVQTMQGFYQGQTSNFSTQVLVNVDQQILGKAYDQTSGNGTLGVGLETRVRYRILGWTTKQHLLKLEGSVPINEEGSLLLSEDGVQLQPVKEKL